MVSSVFVEYIVKSDEPFHDVEGVITFGISELEADLGLYEDDEVCCNRHMVTEFIGGEVRLYLYDVNEKWRPGAEFEQKLKDKLAEDGCELELVA